MSYLYDGNYAELGGVPDLRTGGEVGMKTEEMICELRRLEEAHKDDFVGTGETNWSLMCYDVANRLEELLKAQEPVEPTIGGDADGPCGNWWYQCGKCKEAIDYHDRYCRNCGQAVKWE
jgi:hypothetical protein